MEENANLLLKEIALHRGSFEVEEVANFANGIKVTKIRISILISSVMQVFLLNQM